MNKNMIPEAIPIIHVKRHSSFVILFYLVMTSKRKFYNSTIEFLIDILFFIIRTYNVRIIESKLLTCKHSYFINVLVTSYLSQVSNRVS